MNTFDRQLTESHRIDGAVGETAVARPQCDHMEQRATIFGGAARCPNIQTKTMKCPNFTVRVRPESHLDLCFLAEKMFEFHFRRPRTEK